MRIFWTENALRDRSAIRIFIAMDNPDAATRMDRLFSDAVARLANFPTLGRAGDVVGTRELTPHVNYRLVYEVTKESIFILALIHAARQWPPVER